MTTQQPFSSCPWSGAQGVPLVRPTSPATRPEEPQRPPIRLTAAEAAELAWILAELMAGGAPLADGLEAVAADVKRGRLHRVLRRIANEQRAGVPLEQVLAAADVPSHVRMLLAGVLRRRSLLEGLVEYAFIAQQTVAVPWRIVRLLVYPLAVLALLGFVVMVFAQLAAAGVSMLADAAVQIPPGTMLLIHLARVDPASSVWAVAFMLLGVATVWLWRERPMAWLLFIHALPWIGPLLRWNHTRHFATLLRLLVESQLALPEALAAAGAANGDAALRQAVRRTAHRVEAGAPLSAALESEPLLRGLVPLVAWGEGANMLGEALRSIAELYGARVATRLALIRALLPPMLLVLVGLTVVFVIGATIGSMLNLLKALS